MGYEFEVMEWVRIKEGSRYSAPEYEYITKYSGSSFLKALFIMWRLKKAGAGCVKLEWR